MSVTELAGTPGIYEMEVTQGATFRKQITWFEEDGVTTIDVTGYTARMQIRRVVDADDVLVTLATAENITAEGDITLGGVLGTILLEMSPTVTAALPATPFDRKWRYDLELAAPGGEVRRLLMGKVKVSLEVTR